MKYLHNVCIFLVGRYSAFNVDCRELAPGTISLTGDRAQGDDSKHCAYSTLKYFVNIAVSNYQSRA